MRSKFFVALVAPSVITAATHRMFVGNLFDAPKSIYTMQFDDQTLQLRIIKNTTANTGHSWISLNHDKTALYGVSNQTPQLTTYAVTNNGTDLKRLGAFNFGGTCAGKNSAFVQGSQHPPYRVYSAGWPGPNGCAASHATAQDTGLVTTTQQSWNYAAASGIHGLALARFNDTDLVYSADLNGDAIWTHAVSTTGAVKQLGRVAVPAGSHPRHVAVHPTVNYVYAVMESSNTVVSFTVDPATGAAAKQDATFDLLPPDIRAGLNRNPSTTVQYWSAEVMLSHDGRYLWATSRAGQSAPNNLGYVNGFLLSTDGKVLKQLFQAPTPVKGGFANAIAPAPAELGNEWAAMTDVKPDRSRGGVMMWRMTGKKETELGVEYTGAQVVANLSVNDRACCANIAWYD